MAFAPAERRSKRRTAAGTAVRGAGAANPNTAGIRTCPDLRRDAPLRRRSLPRSSGVPAETALARTAAPAGSLRDVLAVCDGLHGELRTAGLRLTRTYGSVGGAVRGRRLGVEYARNCTCSDLRLRRPTFAPARRAVYRRGTVLVRRCGSCEARARAEGFRAEGNWD